MRQALDPRAARSRNTRCIVTYNSACEGWTWAPDGRKLLVLENHRTRPWVVDYVAHLQRCLSCHRGGLLQRTRL